MTRTRIATTLLVALATVGLTLLGGATPATASPNWIPDEVVVTWAPEPLLTDADLAFLDATGASPGDVLTVEWVEDGKCKASLCPTVTGRSGASIAIPSGSVAVVPAGADSPTGQSTYPSYSRLVALDTARAGLLGEGPYDRPPTDTGPSFVDSPPSGLVWASEETVTDREGTVWRRVAYAGSIDAWVISDRLTAIETEPTAAPPTPETIDPTAPAATTAPLVSTPLDVPPAEQADQEGAGSRIPTGVLLVGGALVVALAGSILTHRRDGRGAP